MAGPVQEHLPNIGMQFSSEQEAYDFYNKYAFKMGFSIRRGNRHLVKNSSTIQQRTFFCSRQGTRAEDKREETFSYSRLETRCNCEARMKITLRNGFYCVYEFVATHSHILAPRDQAHYLRSQRKVTEAQIANAELVKSVGISNKKTIDLMAKEVDGLHNLGFTQITRAKEGDIGRVLEYMERKASDDVGDVVCFDTTYRKLDDGRPFGLIVGVNNHKKTIVFGASLLYDETAESFAWLFKTFLNVMSGKQPQTILTDEDAAMAKAIKLVLTKAHHRICVWHMNQNACKHLAGVVKDYKKFNAAFQHCTYDIEEEDEFLNAWHAMLNISIKYDMLTFFEHFDLLVADKRLEEVKCDFKATQTTPKLKAELNILRHASRVYTAAMFKIFQDQVLQTLNCDIFFCASSDAEKVYKIKKFEFAGILCSHSLKVLDINNVKYIPEHYIMKRWTIDAKALQITRNCNLQEDSKTILSNRYKELCRMFVQIAARAANSKESYFMAANCAEKLAQDVEKCLQIRSDPDMDDLPTSQGVYHNFA
ncbi:hypothetical protein DAI22_03g203866 [Oryza sativa Japonica Group]|nr:hypothetical protein DAI22_03g203866 [Oryza sativa Japonica Group]